MSWDGMYPQHNCKQCNNPLNPNDHRPAELYAGTYTGLCYSCQNLPAYVVTCYKIDNCLIISHSPNSPSHRRDRSEHHAFIDCFVCKGTGHLYVSRSYAVGGSYYRYCADCLDRYYNQPMRMSYTAEVKEITENKIQPYKLALDKQFRKIVPTELKEKNYSECNEADKKLFTKLATPLLAEYDEFRKKAIALPDLLYIEAYEKIEYKAGTIMLV